MIIEKNKKLFPFQIEAIDWMINHRHTLLAHEMGLGKTAMVIGLINKLQLNRVLIVCPASVKRNWLRELNNWLDKSLSIQIIEKRTDIIEPFTQIVIVNYDLITHSNIFNQIREIQFDLGVCDEAHYLKNMKAKRTYAVLSKNGLIRNCIRSVMVTGTPILNRPIELYPILKVLSPATIDPYNDFYKFGRRYCNAFMDGFSFNVNGASHTEELNQRLKSNYMIRRTTSEVAPQLPSKRYQMIFLSMNKDTQIKMDVIENAVKRDFSYQRLGTGGGELATLRRETAEKKLDAAMEYIINCVEQNEKLVIFAYHHSVIKRLEKELEKYGTTILDGTKTSIQRQKVLHNFIQGKNDKVFIGQIQAAGQGIDGLQQVCSNVLFIEWSWVPGEIEQACKRVHRIGQTKPVLIQFLVWENSIEEHMMRVALEKVEVIRKVMK